MFLQFAKAWTEPTAAPPTVNIGAPLTTGSGAQTKTGYVNLAGAMQTPYLYDSNDLNYWVDPSGYSKLNYGIFDGNVGIGTTNPRTKLHIVDGTSPTITLERTGAYAGEFYLNVSNKAANDFAIHDAVNNADRLVILNNGNVGIGTTNPQASLDVMGDLHTYNGNVVFSRTGSVEIAMTATYPTKIVAVNDVGGGASLGFFTSQAGYFADRLHILGNGNVGIGTTAPGAHLQIGSADDSSSWIQMGTNMGIYAYNSSYARIASFHSGTGGLLVEGNVGINTTTPAYMLDVMGQARFTGNYTTSDVRLKTDITDLNYGLGEVMKLRPVSFDWKQPVQGEEGRRVGFIAQEVEQVIPEVVSTASDAMKTKAVEYGNITPVLVKAIQELKTENDQLRQESSALKNLVCADHPQAAVCLK